MGLRCDVCLSPEVRWTHECEAFYLEALGDLDAYQDDGRWVLCAICHEMVVSHSGRGLLQRSISSSTEELRRSMVGIEIVRKRQMLEAFLRTRRAIVSERV